MNKESKIYLAGHRGLVGSALLSLLQQRGYSNLITRTSAQLDLRNQQQVFDFFESEKPHFVFLAAAKVGGIGANSAQPAQFLYDNSAIGFNVVEAARRTGVKKLMNLGSSCIYPKMAPQPIAEESLLNGPLEPTNEAYALAKISTLKLCAAYNQNHGCNFLSAMPTNLYGPGDNYHLENSHVLPAMIRKFHIAKTSGTHQVELWGDGTPLREFLYSADLADALLYLMENCDAADLRHSGGDFVNVGSGEELSILQLAQLVEQTVYADTPHLNCNVVWDKSKPNGTPRKRIDLQKMGALGWRPSTTLAQGIRAAYKAFLTGSERL